MRKTSELMVLVLSIEPCLSISLKAFLLVKKKALRLLTDVEEAFSKQKCMYLNISEDTKNKKIKVMMCI